MSPELQILLFSLLGAAGPVLIVWLKGWLANQGIVKRNHLDSVLGKATEVAVDYVEAFAKRKKKEAEAEVPGGVQKLDLAVTFVQQNYKELKKVSAAEIAARVEHTLASRRLLR